MSLKNKRLIQTLKRPVLEGIMYVLLLVCVVFIVPRYIVQRTIVDGSSMENTFMHGDQLLVEKVTRYVTEFERFDIIVFQPDANVTGDQFIKRIIGLPGETIQIVDGQIYVNETVLPEEFGKMPIENAGIAAEPITLGPEEYFVLGDNRAISLDSRYESVGAVHHSQIEGRVMLQIYPFSKFGTVE